MQKFLEKNYKFIVLAILAFMLVVSAFNAANDSAIFDETAHIGASYSYVSQHEMRLNPEHPPLIKDLAGIPLLFLNLNFDVNQPFWDGTLPGKWDEGQWAAGKYLLYQSGNNPDLILFWSRFPIILISLLLGFFIFKWTKELAGTLAGLFALTLYAFDPNILGHNHFVTTDLAIAAFGTFALYYYLKFIKKPTWKNILIAGVFVGFYELTKFSFFIGLVIFAFITFIYPLIKIPRDSQERLWIFRLKKLCEYIWKGAAVFAISLVVVWIFYTANTFKMSRETIDQIVEANFSLNQNSNTNDIYTNKALHFLNDHALTRPFTEFGIGTAYVFRRVAGGNGLYYMGEVTGKAFLSYFPTVFVIKEPLPSLFLMFSALLISIIGIVKSLQKIASPEIKNRGHEFFSKIAWFLRGKITIFALLTFIVLYSYISITGNLNIGFRHLFPILPFIFILTARSIFNFTESVSSHSRQTLKIIILAILVVLAAGTIYAYPYYMSYFNQIAGGPKNGYYYVTDSNADWGQDLKRLKYFLEEHPEIQKIRVDYFGGGDIKYYLGDKYIMWWDSKRPIEPGWYAISTNFLQGSLYDKTKKDENSYRWILEHKPVYQVGTSLLIYYIQVTEEW